MQRLHHAGLGVPLARTLGAAVWPAKRVHEIAVQHMVPSLERARALGQAGEALARAGHLRDRIEQHFRRQAAAIVAGVIARVGEVGVVRGGTELVSV